MLKQPGSLGRRKTKCPERKVLKRSRGGKNLTCLSNGLQCNEARWFIWRQITDKEKLQIQLSVRSAHVESNPSCENLQHLKSAASPKCVTKYGSVDYLDRVVKELDTLHTVKNNTKCDSFSPDWAEGGSSSQQQLCAQWFGRKKRHNKGK